jgi:tetratricopeptide (TPR) repeat protein
MGIEVIGLAGFVVCLGLYLVSVQYTNSAQGLSVMGLERLRKDNPEGALEYFDRALEKNPHLAQAYRGRAMALERLGDYDGALAACQQAIKLEPEKASESLLTRSSAYVKLGKSGEAVADLSQLICLYPNETIYYRSRADAYKNLNRIEDALADLDYIVEKLDKADFLTYSQRSVIHFESQNFEAAIADFEAMLAIADTPENMRYPAYQLMGAAYREIGRYDEGIAAATLMIELSPNTVLGYSSRGLCFLKKDIFDKALSDYQRALELEPDNSYYEAIATCYFNLGQTSEALDAINKFIPAMPDHAPGYRIRGLIYMRLRKRPEAVEDFTRYLETYADNALINNNIAWLKSFLGLYDEALVHINKAMERADDATVHDTRGQVYWLMGNYEAALADYEQAQNLDNTHVGFQVGKIVALFSLGRKDEAIAAWQQIQARDDGLTTAEALQDEYGYAPQFYAAMQQVEALAKGE